ncbi:MAG: DNA polymerase [Patescibacteria group bacterium]
MKTLLLIDASSLIHRAFHALPPLTTPEGEPIGAIYGLSSILIKVFKESPPEFVAAALDRPEPTFREEIFKDYKAHRPETAEELKSQLARAEDVFRKFQVPVFEAPGFEADDIIASIAEKFRKDRDLRIVILTGDLDALQLVEGDKVVVQTMKKGVSETFVYDEGAVKKRYGLGPQQLTDYKGFVGDPSDNIPGVKGVGPKGATKILEEFGTLENVFKRMKPDHPLAEKVLAHEEAALFSKKLATVKRDVPLEARIENLVFSELDLKNLVRYFTELGFQSLVLRLQKPTKRVAALSFDFALESDVLIFPSLESIEKNPDELKSEKLKIAFDWKEILKNITKKSLEIAGPLFDLRVAGWLLDPDQKDFSIEALVKRFLLKDLEKMDSSLFSELFRFFKSKLTEYELDYVFEKIEMPLVPVLAEMEKSGVALNKEGLFSLKSEIEKELEVLAKKIYEGAGTTFNINSPRQVAEIIFEKLKIGEKTQKTATGQKSTAEKVLFELKEKHPIVGLILDYRENFKVKTGFVEPLLDMLGSDNRVRTSFSQTGTSTGRLSSLKPNLQNIPQESKWAKSLRETFEAPEGYSLLSFDYSQLELRLLAHISNDEKLKNAFMKGWDVHELTASQVFNVPLEKVTPEMRRLGKTLNFGVIYGMGGKSFALTSGLSFEEAGKFIREYFERFPAVKTWQEKTKAEARTFGFVKNPNGRRRWFIKDYRGDEIDRAAINMPIQSLGADIIKLAMIESFRFLKKGGVVPRGVKLLLSIHDELLFEVRNDTLKEIAMPLKKIMENIYPLSVPLKVEAKVGENWGEMKKLENA